ncbi:MAG: hypothetical protein K2O42_02510, partial [Oscillospiraceae bacterium]|nr:hypothetical protein [Oscillospiraceae bacterium]
KQQQKAPTPKCICFYNGTDHKQDRMILSLADTFEKDSAPDIEVKVTMININYGHNKELLNTCKPLNEYAWFVEKVRTIQKTTTVFEETIDQTLSEMPDDFLIKPFLVANKAEVKHMCITEYDEERTFAEQREEGAFEMLVNLVKQGVLSLQVAAEQAKMTVTEFEIRAGLSE